MDIQQTPAAKKTFYPIPLSEEVEVELDFTQWFESLYAFNQNFLSEIRDAQLEDKPKPQKKRKRKQLGYRVYNVPGGERQLCIRNASICSEEQIRDLWKKKQNHCIECHRSQNHARSIMRINETSWRARKGSS